MYSFALVSAGVKSFLIEHNINIAIHVQLIEGGKLNCGHVLKMEHVSSIKKIDSLACIFSQK